MGTIKPEEIFVETFSRGANWLHFYFPIALIGGVLGMLINEAGAAGMLLESSTLPENQLARSILVAWVISIFGYYAVQTLQLSLFDSIMERDADWPRNGFLRALRRLVPALVAMIVYTLAIMVGMILLIIPGLMAMMLLMMMLPLVVLDGLGPIEALKASWKLTWGNAWRLFGSMLLVSLPLLALLFIAGYALGVIGADADPMIGVLMDWGSGDHWAWLGLTALLGAFYTSFYLVAFKALKAAAGSGSGATPASA